MKGLNTLRIALGAIAKTHEPLAAAAYVLAVRPPRDLDGIERLLLEHLATVEDALAHVRRMKIAATRKPHPIEETIARA